MNEGPVMRIAIGVFAAIGVWMVVVIALLYAVAAFDATENYPQRTLETITRYEAVINGERVECERREDHVRGTVEVAC